MKRLANSNLSIPPQTSGTIYRWRVLAATFLTYFIDSYDLIVLAIAMPVLLKVLNISLPEGGLLGSAISSPDPSRKRQF